MTIKVAFLVNGESESPAAFRARNLAANLNTHFQAETAYRGGNKKRAIFHFLKFLRSTKPQITYVVDMAYSGVLAGLVHRLAFGGRLVIDTGDAIYVLARSMGRSRIGLCLTWLLEAISLRLADRIVVRGTLHKQLLSVKGVDAEVIQDGVESALFRPMDVSAMRRHYQLDGVHTVGFVGSITWSPRLQMCYGTELVEVLHLLRDLPLKGVVIGDGSGLEMLKARAREYGVADRILFLGRIPHRELPGYLNLIDICLSTQTNDTAGQVRTTGKLPLYLSAGRFVLASRVGEAALVLPDNMLVDYENATDSRYPEKLAAKIRAACADAGLLHASEASRSIAERYFDYGCLGRRLATVLEAGL